jgi:hypothetical protein
MAAPFSRIFIEVPVTHREMIEVLTKLGYHPEFDGKYNRYINEKYKSIVLMPIDNLDEMMGKADVAAFSSRLYRQGVIKEEENLIKKIQANRLKKAKKVSKNEPQLV